jgi:hypothetical protein
MFKEELLVGGVSGVCSGGDVSDSRRVSFSVKNKNNKLYAYSELQ